MNQWLQGFGQAGQPQRSILADGQIILDPYAAETGDVPVR